MNFIPLALYTLALLVRTVADGGESFYVQGDHRDTLPALRREALVS